MNINIGGYYEAKLKRIMGRGVAANKRLQQMLEVMCKERGAKFYCVPREFAGDNAAMIVWTGILMKNAGMETKNEILPRQRTDDVDTKWM